MKNGGSQRNDDGPHQVGSYRSLKRTLILKMGSSDRKET